MADPATTSENKDTPNLAQNVKRLRRQNGWKLTQLAKETGLPQSTLSKVENGQMSLNYDKLLRLAEVLDVDIRNLFETPAEIEAQTQTLARRTIDRVGDSDFHSEDHYRYTYLCNDLKNRLMIPLLFEVHDVSESGASADAPIKMMNVIGERFAYVLQGPVEFHCDHYEMATLETGDSIYVDAAMPHAFVAKDGREAKVLTILSSGNADYLRFAQEVAMRGEADATNRFMRQAAKG